MVRLALKDADSYVTKRWEIYANTYSMQHMNQTKTQKLVELFRSRGVVRSRELIAHGIPREYLVRLQAQGVLERPTRGIYVLAESEPSEHQGLVEACKRLPHAVVCLLSALRFHKLTTQTPFEVWLAIDCKARLPKMDYPPLRVVRFPSAMLKEGVKKHQVQGVTLPVTSPARTVVDCFVYRNKIGLDVALEALRDCLRTKKATMDELHRTAKARRMANVMRPYMESLA
jgi:predicted transcriptional regulator of viral defense system